MVDWARPVLQRVGGSVLAETFRVAYRTRLTGLAAEASFWGIFALPWLVLGLVAGLAKFGAVYHVDALGSFRERSVEIAEKVLTPAAIAEILTPFLDSVLSQGRGTIGAVGLAVALYAGSRVLGALVDGMAIVYRMEGIRSFVAARALSLGVYLVGLAVCVVVLPGMIAGPRMLVRLVPGIQSTVISALLLVAQLVLLLVALVSLYHVAAPHRTRWLADLPGAVLAIVAWTALSYGLRWYFGWIFRDGSVYAAISAPIAVMWWVYVTCLALLLGAAFNGALAVRRGWYRPAPADPQIEGSGLEGPRLEGPPD